MAILRPYKILNMKSENKSKPFAHNAMKLVSGNLLAQLSTIALMPVITCIYSTDSYGKFSIIIAIAMTITPVSCLRYNAVIVLANDNEECKALVYLSLKSLLVDKVLLSSLSKGAKNTGKKLIEENVSFGQALSSALTLVNERQS